MNASNVFARIFDPPAIDTTRLIFADPIEIAEAAESPEVAAWTLLLGSMALRRAGESGPANAWLNAAVSVQLEDDLFRAELLGEAGQSLSQGDRLQDAVGVLDSAEAIWRDVCAEAIDASGQRAAAIGFATRLLPIFTAAGTDPPVDEEGVRSGRQALWLIRLWLSERAVIGRARSTSAYLRLLAKSGRTDDARQILDAALSWTIDRFVTPGEPGQPFGLDEPHMSAATRRALYYLRLAKGELDLAEGDAKASAASFAEAAATYEGNAQDYGDVSALLQAKFNQANSLLRLGRIPEAVKIFELCEHGFGSIGDANAGQRVAHAKLYARSLVEDEVSLEDDVRTLVIEGEDALRHARNPGDHREALLPQYGLYLKILSRSKRPALARADDYLRVVRAVRDADTFANLERDFLGELTLERLASSPLRVLFEYLQRLPDTAVLMIEPAPGVVTLLGLRGGSSPLEERIALERASQPLMDALVGLLRQQYADIARIERREPITAALFEPIEQAGAAVWAEMPPGLRAMINSCGTILFLPSAFGDLSALPLELVRGEDGWLGATKSITRLSSLRTLLELLSPNRMPSSSDERALVVRARDSDDLTGGEAEIASVSVELKRMGVAVDVDLEPSVAKLRNALDQGLRAIHYCGHGFAGSLGESLPLGPNEVLGPHDFSQLSGARTPFVYLSTCEVGRARMGATGNALGISTRLIEKGSLGVIGCLSSVPDAVATAMAGAFYGAAASLPAGKALATARSELTRYPPSCWGAFAYFGDPNLRLDGAHSSVPSTRQLTSTWDSWLGRHVATRSPETRRRALESLRPSLKDPAGTSTGPSLLDSGSASRVAGWLETSFAVEETESMDVRLDLCRQIAASDAVAGCELRMLLAMEFIHGGYQGTPRPDIVFAPDQIAVGLALALSLHDTIAWPAFVLESARIRGFGYTPLVLAKMLEQAVGMLEGWALEEPDAQKLLTEALTLRDEDKRSRE